MLTRRDPEKLKYEMFEVKYVDLGDGSDPIVLGTTAMSTHTQRSGNPVWNKPVIGTVEGGPYDLLPSQCVLSLVGGPAGTECDV